MLTYTIFENALNNQINDGQIEQDQREQEQLNNAIVKLYIDEHEPHSDVFYPHVYVAIKNKHGLTIKMNTREFDWLLSWQTVPRVGIFGGIGCVQYSPIDKTQYMITTIYWETGQQENNIKICLDEFTQLKKAHHDMVEMTEKSCEMLKQHNILHCDSKWLISDFAKSLWLPYLLNAK